MVALPTPARAATASIESASAAVPSASRSMTASMTASSTRELRGRPGALRSATNAGASEAAEEPGAAVLRVPGAGLVLVVMCDIVVQLPPFGQFQRVPVAGPAVRGRRALGVDRGGRRRDRGRPARQPGEYHADADHGDDRRSGRGPVH